MINESIYNKTWYKTNRKPYGNGFIEIQISKFPFHSGGQLRVTDGFNCLYVRDYLTLVQLLTGIKALRTFLKQG